MTRRNAYKSAERSESSTDKKLPDQNQNPRVVKSQQVEKKIQHALTFENLSNVQKSDKFDMKFKPQDRPYNSNPWGST